MGDERSIDGLWHLVCQTEKGLVSIIRNLDLRTARETYKRLRPDERPTEYILPEVPRSFRINGGWGSYGANDDRLAKVDVIGPPGEEFDPWFGVETEIVDYRTQWEQAKAAGEAWDRYGNPTGNPEPLILTMAQRV